MEKEIQLIDTSGKEVKVTLTEIQEVCRKEWIIVLDVQDGLNSEKEVANTISKQDDWISKRR
jgi:hypothetical protein